MKVIYSPEQNATFDRQVGSSSPSASKPEKVMADWKEHGIPMDVIPSPRLTLRGISRVHKSGFVMDIMDGDLDNGFGNRSMEVAESLRYTNGQCVRLLRWPCVPGSLFVPQFQGFTMPDGTQQKGSAPSTAW